MFISHPKGLQLDISNRFAAPSVSGLFTLGWMCSLKREQGRRERESYVSLTHSRLYCRDREKN